MKIVAGSHFSIREETSLLRLWQCIYIQNRIAESTIEPLDVALQSGM